MYMAARRTPTGYDQRYRNTAGQMYVYGNGVPKPEQEPERRQVRRPKKRVSRQVQRNRKKALRMSPGYVVFLSAAAILALIICVNYVKLQSRMTGYSKNISALQGQLANMKEENNTKYNAIMDSVNLEEIRERAQENLGMVYATSEQVIEYQRPSADYVKQYENIPEDGVLAQSDKK